MPYVTRILLSGSTGEFNFANTNASYFVLAAMMGLSMYGSRKISVDSNDREKLNKSFSALYLIQLINGIICLIAYVGYILIFYKTDSTIAWINCIYVVSVLFDLTWFISGLERFRSLAVRNIAIHIISTICIFVFVKQPNDLIVYAIIKCSSVLLSQLLLFLTVWRHVSLKKVDKKTILINYRHLLVLFVPVLSETVFHNMDRTMLGAMIGFSAVGIYYASRMVTDIPQTVVTSINLVMYPRLSKLESIGETEQTKNMFDVCFEFVNMLCVALSFGIAAIAFDFVSIYFGPDYQECAKCIPLLAPYIAIAAWNGTIRYQILLPKNKEKIYVFAIIIGIAFNLVLNIFLIKAYGIQGAIFATLISEFVVLLIQTYAVRKEVSVLFHGLNFIFYGLAGTAMYFAVKGISSALSINIIAKLLVEILVGGLMYLSICTLYILLNKKLKISIKSVLFKRKENKDDINNNACL